MYQSKYVKSTLKRKYKAKLKTINYWDRVEKKFIIRKKLKIKQFSMSFPHDIRSQIVKDSEDRIEMLAEKYGYQITDEKLTTSQSIYWFKLIN